MRISDVYSQTRRSSHRLLSRQGRDDKRIDTEVTRYRKHGSVLGRYDSLYIVTKEDGRGASRCAAASSPSSSEAVDWHAPGYFRSVASQLTMTVRGADAVAAELGVSARTRCPSGEMSYG